jgi:putative heme utilization carrier protein HutX
MSARQKLVDRLKADPGAIVEKIAKEENATPRDVVEALPQEMRKFAPGSAFVEVMKDIGGWGDVTLIVHTEDGIMEVGGPVAAGEVSHGYYNVPGSKGFHGHLRHERCNGIAFVERPFMDKSSASVLFFNIDGGIMFKVFVGRDENRALKPDQLEKFRKLAARLCA